MLVRDLLLNSFSWIYSMFLVRLRDGVIEAKQKEFDEMSKDNKALRNGKETLERQQ
jgi:hypothetical protein